MIARILSKCPECSKKKMVYINKPARCYSCGNYYCTVALECDQRDYDFLYLNSKETINNYYMLQGVEFETLGIDRIACCYYPYPVAYETRVGDIDVINYGCEFVILTKKINFKSTNTIYLVYPCYYSDCSKTYYHGTPGHADAIIKDGWKIPETWDEKSNGFLGFERGLRYAGIDMEPALIHCGSNASARQIVKIKYDGWVLKTRLCVGGEKFRKLFEALKGVFGAIEYRESGRSIVFSEKSKPRPAGWFMAAGVE